MNLTQYQVDAFTTEVFTGNPAAVCPLEGWLDDGVMQAIAGENNLSETAFFVPTGQGFHLRWFSPVREVDLCGHATLASAHVLFEHLGYDKESVTFETRTGELVVERRDGRLAMDFPVVVPKPCATPEALAVGLGREPSEVLAADDYVAVFGDEATIRGMEPDYGKLRELDLRGVCVTAPGEEVDFVSRFFAPRYGIPEDPVTGSAHCKLAPYWSARLGKEELEARQVSKRGGAVHCRMNGDRVVLSGSAVTFMVGEISIPD
ncbi:MAG: PhzF family phenazine biosynthesis protein [Nitrospirota bacterium]|jgi:PhzF family phenazine biosynthesis protein